MSLNNPRRIQLERSGPWIGVAGLFFLLWIAIASSQFAPWWGVALFVVLLIPASILVAKWARTRPRRAAFVPLGSLGVWFAITIIGLNFWGWEADEPETSLSRVLSSDCAANFENLRQTMAENGNPGQPGRQLTIAWDAVNAEATKLAKDAEASDCPGNLDSMTDRVAGIEDLIYGSEKFDMVLALARAEDDLEHAEATRDYDPMPDKLRRAFDTLVIHAPKSKIALQSRLDAVDATDPLDQAARRASLAELKSAAEADAEYQACQRALEIIGNYELSEE